MSYPTYYSKTKKLKNSKHQSENKVSQFASIGGLPFLPSVSPNQSKQIFPR